jgi:hypothetical protein
MQSTPSVLGFIDGEPRTNVDTSSVRTQGAEPY